MRPDPFRPAPGFKRTLIADHGLAATMRAWESSSAREVRELEWTEHLARLLREVSSAERADPRQSAPWKIRLAVHMKSSTDASNRWLAAQLHMGSPAYLAKLVSLARRQGAR